MTIAEFIRAQLRERLLKAGVLVVYDPAQRYHELCSDLASDKIRAVDTSESSIASREAALLALREIGGQLDGLLVYVPAQRPQSDEQKQIDPFAIYAEGGAVFPQDDGDEYQNLCLKFKPDQALAIRQAFAAAPAGPDFAVIDAIGTGASWPQLRAALKVESSREILLALLAPNPAQQKVLEQPGGWLAEARAFLRDTLEMSLKSQTSWEALALELWRYLLFSEFVFDLPVALPAALAGVPQAPRAAQIIVYDVCDQLRHDQGRQDLYISRAETIEHELNLVELCRAIEDLGERDTFPFEERTFLGLAIKGIINSDPDTTRRVLEHHQKNSVWLKKGESQAQWQIVRAAHELVAACADYERELPEHSRNQAALLDFYLAGLREVDRLQREFEEAASNLFDSHELLDQVISHARSRYNQLMEKVQALFSKHLENQGWPPPGRLANTEVFDRHVAGRLKESGHKVAYLLVDALRYELGVELAGLLDKDYKVELQAAYSQLPSNTLVGMASLLPGAGSQLSLSLSKGSLVPLLAGAPVSNVKQRMEILRQHYGDRFSQQTLKDFRERKAKIPETVELLVLRSGEIDTPLENVPESTLSSIPNTLKAIRGALQKLAQNGFNDAIIAADHGFFLNSQLEAGAVCPKPPGNWPVNTHERMLLGAGSADSHNLVLSASKLGIRGDFAQAALPKSMAPYSAGLRYFHGGASLAEAVVPVLIVQLASRRKPEPHSATVRLGYKNGASRITTRVPVIEVSLESSDMFAQELGLEIMLEARDSQGRVVGQPRPGPDVNPAAGTITLLPGQRKQIALGMDPRFEGKFTVEARNPTTQALASKNSILTLETDYTV